MHHDSHIVQRLRRPPPSTPKVEFDKGLLRCNFCPSPSELRMEDKFVHMEFHKDKMFLCAACPKRKEFDNFVKIVEHINQFHSVSDVQIVLETIILPTSEGGLRNFKCGVANCGREFTGLAETDLKTHMKRAHGDYYVRVGRGKYMLRLCRICGDAETFATIAEVDLHIQANHPVRLFGNLADLEEEQEEAGSVTDNLLGNLSAPRENITPRQAHTASSSPGQPRPTRSPRSTPQQMTTTAVKTPRRTSPFLITSQKSLTSQKQPRPDPLATDDSEHSPLFGKSLSSRKEDSPVFGRALLAEREVTPPEFGKYLPAMGKRLKTEDDDESPVFGKSITKGAENFQKSLSKNLEMEKEPDEQEEGEISSEEESHAKKKKKKMNTKKKKSFPVKISNSEDSDSETHKEKTMKVKKEKGVTTTVESFKNLSVEEKVAKMNPKQLKLYLKQLKSIKKENKIKLKSKKKALLDEYPRNFRGKKAHYYCLICSENVGSLKKWRDHQRTRYHMETFDAANEEAKKKYKCQDIDLRECAITTQVLKGDISDQCRVCYKLFRQTADIQLHMKSGVCPDKDKAVDSHESKESVKDLSLIETDKPVGKMSDSQSLYRGRWSMNRSPLPLLHRRRSHSAESSEHDTSAECDERNMRQLDIGTGSDRRDDEEKFACRLDPSSALLVVPWPKYMMNGRQAYYFCNMCKIPIGTVMHWNNHVKTQEHKENYASDSRDMREKNLIEFSVSQSVIQVNYRNHCLACDIYLEDVNRFNQHLEDGQHLEKNIRMEIKDGNDLRQGGERFSNFYFCELCEDVFPDPPKDHKYNEHHILLMAKTEKCYFCRKRYVPEVLVDHIDECHQAHVFVCNHCPTKFINSDKMLEHVRVHLTEAQRKTYDTRTILKTGIIKIPKDLRKIECKCCESVCFLGQDAQEPNSHVLEEHGMFAFKGICHCLTFGCRICSQTFKTENEMNSHVDYHVVDLNLASLHDAVKIMLTKEPSLSPVIIRHNEIVSLGRDGYFSSNRSRSRSPDRAITFNQGPRDRSNGRRQDGYARERESPRRSGDRQSLLRERSPLDEHDSFEILEARRRRDRLLEYRKTSRDGTLEHHSQGRSPEPREKRRASPDFMNRILSEPRERLHDIRRSRLSSAQGERRSTQLEAWNSRRTTYQELRHSSAESIERLSTAESRRRPSPESMKRIRSPESSRGNAVLGDRQRNPKLRYRQRTPDSREKRKTPESRKRLKESRESKRTPEPRERKRTPKLRERIKSQESKERRRTPDSRIMERTPELRSKQKSHELLEQGKLHESTSQITGSPDRKKSRLAKEVNERLNRFKVKRPSPEQDRRGITKRQSLNAIQPARYEAKVTQNKSEKTRSEGGQQSRRLWKSEKEEVTRKTASKNEEDKKKVENMRRMDKLGNVLRRKFRKTAKASDVPTKHVRNSGFEAKSISSGQRSRTHSRERGRRSGSRSRSPLPPPTKKNPTGKKIGLETRKIQKRIKEQIERNQCLRDMLMPPTTRGSIKDRLGAKVEEPALKDIPIPTACPPMQPVVPQLAVAIPPPQPKKVGGSEVANMVLLGPKTPNVNLASECGKIDVPNANLVPIGARSDPYLFGSYSKGPSTNTNLMPLGQRGQAPAAFAYPPPPIAAPHFHLTSQIVYQTPPTLISQKSIKHTISEFRQEGKEKKNLDKDIKKKEEELLNKKDEADILNRLKQKASDDDLRRVIEQKKVTMLDSRPEGVKLEKPSSSVTEAEMCPLCGNLFKDLDELLKHMKNNHLESMFGCKLCKAVGWNVEILFKHITETHDKTATMSEALHRMKLPRSLERVNCKMCPPPRQLGQEGMWLCVDPVNIKSEIDSHFNFSHQIKDQNVIHSKLELVCRCCVATFGASQQSQWSKHLTSHCGSSSSEPKVGVRCDYCGESVVESEMMWHIENEHNKDVFLCRICTASDTTCFPFAASLKEMMQHMVMKHGDQFDSFYDHMTYPKLLFRSGCINEKCLTDGKFIALTKERVKSHLEKVHPDLSEFLYYCRCCDKTGQSFKSVEEVEAHIAKRHKQITKWKQTNGNN